MSESAEKSDRKRSGWMTAAREHAIFLAFFCLNVLVAYAPTPLFRREASFSIISPKDVLLRVPVALVYRAVESYMRPNPWGGHEQFKQGWRKLTLIGRGLVVAFLLILLAASGAFYDSKKAWVAMPSIVLAYSLLQALIAGVIEGLNALGGV